MNNSAVARPSPQISSLCDILGPDTRRNQLQGLKGRGLLLCLPDHSRRACVMPGGGRSTPGYMRYADGGGLTASGRARRATVRLSAAAMSGQDVKPVQVRHELRVNTKSAYQWRRRWRAGGTPALASKGAGGAVCRLGSAQVSRLRAALDQGPAVWGWAEDQRWTLERGYPGRPPGFQHIRGSMYAGRRHRVADRGQTAGSVAAITERD